jgi:hypothetical protein
MPAAGSTDSKSRIVLNDALAVEIYKCKLAFDAPSSSVSFFQSRGERARGRGQSARVSSRFGVSPKTIRDVWNHKTWAHATNHLWTQPPDGSPVSSAERFGQIKPSTHSLMNLSLQFRPRTDHLASIIYMRSAARDDLEARRIVSRDSVRCTDSRLPIRSLSSTRTAAPLRLLVWSSQASKLRFPMNPIAF